MRILLVAPASGRWHGLGRKRFFNGKTFRFSMLSLLSVAALTPDRHQITIVDEQIDEIPWGEPFDLVGITVMTATAPRTYALCARFRARAIPVVLGGFHVTFNVEEAARHASAVVVGPAGGAWPDALADVESGALKAVYHGNPDLPVPVALPRHLLNRSVFESTLGVLDDIGIDVMQASILTPLPGTRLFDEMRARIVDDNWEHYDYKWAVFEPAQMTRAELMAGLEWINKRFYAPWRILRRLVRWLAMPSGLGRFYVPLLLNVAYWGRQFQFHVRGYNPRRPGRRGVRRTDVLEPTAPPVGTGSC